MLKGKRIILGVTGSIAAYKSCEIIRRLKGLGLGVTVVMSKAATNFISPLTLQTLSGNKVYNDLFVSQERWDPSHISLAETADLVLIAPATANIIGKLASGLCDDLLSCVVLSTSARVLIAPAMNQNMYRNKIVRQNIERLKKIGYKFIGPVKGELACGYEGIGCLAPVEAIVKEVKRVLK